jgi:hypothetical protein
MRRIFWFLIFGLIGTLLLAASFGRKSTPENLPPMDFSRSFVTFVTRGRGNNARIQVEARCVLKDPAKGTTEEYFLLASCKSEDTYGQGDLFTKPNYDFSAIFSRKDYRLIRQHASASNNNPSVGAIPDFFDDVVFHIQPAGQPQVLRQSGDIVEATLKNRILVGRTELTLKDGKIQAILDYPIKTINVNDRKTLFQIDTGPLLFPNLDSAHTRTIEAFEHAFLAYKTFDRAEFISLQPTFILDTIKNVTERERFLPLKAALSVNHYSATRKLAAKNTLMAIP